MNLFYQPDPDNRTLTGDEAAHAIRVLRLRQGNRILLTDGRGTRQVATLHKVGQTSFDYFVEREDLQDPDLLFLEIAVCPTRKADRNEWMVEKLCEIGVQRISFVASEHTHRAGMNRSLNLSRVRKIALSAMKQSHQYFLPEIATYESLEKYLSGSKADHRYLSSMSGRILLHESVTAIDSGRCSVLIGPEGDFSVTELEAALSAGFVPVTLGPTRLRTETAAVLACYSVQLAQVKPSRRISI